MIFYCFNIVLTIPELCPSIILDILHILETEVANDVSVCSGVVQKTKHQIIGLSQNQTAVTKQGEPVPVTPGTVRKVLGKIEQQYVM